MDQNSQRSVADKPSNTVKEISIHELRKRIQNGERLFLLDIREKREIDTGYIKGAIFLELEKIREGVEEKIKEKDVPVVIYCGFGIKSLDAGRILKEMGYKDVYSLREGFEGWRAHGYEIESDSRLSSEELIRYSRHILLKEIGLEGQLKLLNSRVLIVGCGGLGSPSALYLAAAGIGTIGLIDNDCVDISNLQRQIIHRTEDVGKPKVESAKRTIEMLNPKVNVVTYNERLTKDNVLSIFREYDLVIDGSDNFPTKFLVNDACFFTGIPDVFGGVFQFEGQLSVFYPRGGGPCLRCLFPLCPPRNVVPSCSEVGILGVVPGLIGIFQALEAIKLLLGIGETLLGKFFTLDALTMNVSTYKAQRNPACPLCGKNPEIREIIEESPQVCEINDR